MHDNSDIELLREPLGYPSVPNPKRESETFRHMPRMLPSQGGLLESSSRPPGHGYTGRPATNKCMILIQRLELTDLEKRQIRAMPRKKQNRAVSAEPSKFTLDISLRNDNLIEILVGPCLVRKSMDAL